MWGEIVKCAEKIDKDFIMCVIIIKYTRLSKTSIFERENNRKQWSKIKFCPQYNGEKTNKITKINCGLLDIPRCKKSNLITNFIIGYTLTLLTNFMCVYFFW
jgi:hypothetical protein